MNYDFFKIIKDSLIRVKIPEIINMYRAHIFHKNELTQYTDSHQIFRKIDQNG